MHVDEYVNTRITDTIAEYFGELTVSIENHKFLGTYIEFLGNGKVLLFMKYYIEEYVAFGE